MQASFHQRRSYRGLSRGGGELAERVPLVIVGARGANSQYLEKNLRSDAESGRGWLFWNPISPENTQKNEKNNLLKTKRILKPKYKLV